MNELALFAGAGGGILGGHLLGWRTVCAVELDAYAAGVLVARQNDDTLPPFPIWDNVSTFDGRPWRGIVDVVSGGFPCQDISTAGKGAGITGARSGLWGEMARIVGDVRPRFVFVENSPALTCRGLGKVLGDLATLGYDAEWGVLGAHHAGAPHRRDRIWIVAHATVHPGNARRPQPTGQQRQARLADGAGDMAHAHSDRCQPSDGRRPVSDGEREHTGAQPGRHHQQPRTGCDGAGVPNPTGQPEREPADQAHAVPTGGQARVEPGNGGGDAANAHGAGCEEQRGRQPIGAQHAAAECRGWWEVEPGLGRVVDGMANRVERLRAIGNGQVPAVAALAWKILLKRLEESR